MNGRALRRPSTRTPTGIPQECIDLLARDGPREGAKLERTDHGYRISVGKLANAFSDEFVSLELRLAGMDRQGVDVQLMSLTTPMVYWASPRFGLALSQAYNDAASAAHLQASARLYSFAMVPMQDPALALRELERAAKLPGMRGLYLATSVDGTELDDKRYWDIYAKCEEIGWPIFLHPVYTIGVERTTRYYLRNLLGNPYDTGMAAASLIFGGVLDAFPRLEFNLPHAGGTLPGLIGRLDHGTRVRPELKHMKKTAQRVPAPLHLRHHRPRRPHQHEPGAPGRRRSRDPRQRLLLRHGARRPGGRRRAPARARRSERNLILGGRRRSCWGSHEDRFLLLGLSRRLRRAARPSAIPAYPSRPITMLVPLQAGTAVDNVARAIAQKMSANLGRPIVVENVPGAAGQIGTERLARAAPDGYTIGFVNDSILTMLPNLNAKLGYDPLKDLAPVRAWPETPSALR
jgi:aminocarboxymuconate-semialdehyde decarboxylase